MLAELVRTITTQVASAFAAQGFVSFYRLSASCLACTRAGRTEGRRISFLKRLLAFIGNESVWSEGYLADIWDDSLFRSTQQSSEASSV